MEFVYQSPVDESNRTIYNCVLEEIALEGLDGITLQGLAERLIDREGSPVNRNETFKLMPAIWESLKVDQRLKFYFLPEARPNLKIWNRHLSIDSRGNVEENEKSPEDIYPYKCIEIFQDEDPNNKNKESADTLPLCLEDIQRIDLRRRGKCSLDFEIDGIMFERSRVYTGQIHKTKKKSRSDHKTAKESELPVMRGRGRPRRDDVSRMRLQKIKDLESKEFLKIPESQNKNVLQFTTRSGRNTTRQNAMFLLEGRSSQNTDKDLSNTKSKSIPQKGKSGNVGDVVVSIPTKSKTRVENSRPNSKTLKTTVVELPPTKKEVSKKDLKSTSKKGKGNIKKEKSSEVKPNEGNNDWDGKTADRLAAIRGSCEHFDERKDVTNRIRKLNMSYVDVVKKLRNRLVIVASQFVRESVLFDSANQIRTAGPQYSMIERIGRARHYGEQARGKISLTCLKIDAKAQFYHRKTLLADGLIAKQGFIMKFPDGRTGTLISIFHLPRFFRRLESSETINLRRIFAHICNSPTKTAEFLNLQKIFGKYIMKTLQNDYGDFIYVEEESFAVLYPGEYEKEKKQSRKDLLQKRKVRVIKLKNPETAVGDVIQRQIEITREEGDTPMMFHESTGETDEGEEFDWAYTFNSSTCYAHELEATSLVKLVIMRGNRGLLLQDIGDRLEITHLDSRSASRYLSRRQVVKGITEERDKIKVVRYVYVKCDGPVQTVVSSADEEDEKGCSEHELALGSSVFNSTETDSINSPFSNTSIHSSESSSPMSPCSTSPILPSPSPSLPLPPDSLISPITIQDESSPNTHTLVLESPSKKEPETSKDSKTTAKLKLSKPMEVSPEKALCELPSVVETVESYSRAMKDKPTPPSPKKTSAAKKKNKSESLLKRVQKKLLFKNHPSLETTSAASLPKSKLEEGAEQTPPKKTRKRFYDDVDLKALALLRRQRVDWSAFEDRCLHYLFLSSVLFIPRYNMQRVFIYNATQIRDILHQICESSKTKTSLAVRRRLHFLMRNRVFFAKYRQNLNTALRDDHLYSNFVEPYLPPPSINVFHAIPNHALKEVFIYIRNKFEGKGDFQGEDGNYNRSLHELLNQRELRRMEGIWTDIWGNFFKHYQRRKTKQEIMMQSSLQIVKLEHVEYETNDDDNVFESNPEIATNSNAKKEMVSSASLMDVALSKQQRKVQEINGKKTYAKVAHPFRRKFSRHVRNQYYDEELQYAFQVTKSLLESINVSDNSDENSDNETQLELHEFSSSGKPSKKRRRLDPKLESKIIQERKRHRKNRRMRLRKRHISGPKAEIVCCERDARDTDDVIVWTGRTAILSMIFSEELLESIQSFIASIPDEHLEKVMNSLRSHGIISVTKRTGKFNLSSQMKRQLVTYVSPTTFRVAQSVLTVCSKNKRGIPSVQPYYHLGTVYLLGDIGLALKMIVTLPECIITVHKEWKRDYDLLLKSNENFAIDKENYALRLLRVRLNANPDSEKVKFVEKDFFDINLPQIKLKPKKSLTLNKLVYGNSKPHSQKDKIFLENSLIQIVEFNEKTTLFGAPDGEIVLRDSAWLYNIIHICGETGVSVRYLLTKFPKEDLKKNLMYLIDCNYIYMVGVRTRKFVAACFMKNWTTAVPRRSDGKLVRRVVMRPWMNSKGGMNWDLLDRAYSSILGVLQRHPVISVEEICKNLIPVFSYVEAMILLSTLVQMGIIEVYRMKRRKRVRIFRKRTRKFNKEDMEAPYKDYNVDAFLQMETLYAELTPFHTVKYAKLQKIIFPPSPTGPVEKVQVESAAAPEKVNKKRKRKEKTSSKGHQLILEDDSKESPMPLQKNI